MKLSTMLDWLLTFCAGASWAAWGFTRDSLFLALTLVAFGFSAYFHMRALLLADNIVNEFMGKRDQRKLIYNESLEEKIERETRGL